jgi:outer membrane protein, heavy metal efflux system
VAQALASNVELARRDREIAEQEARMALARAQRSPDPALQTVVTHDSQPDFAWGWRLGVSVPLPGRAPRAALAVEELRLAELEAGRAAAVARIEADLGSAVALAAALHAQVATLVQEVLPRSEEIAALGLEAYRSGQSDLADLLQTLAARREVALQTLAQGLELQRALADVEQALGVPLP